MRAAFALLLFFVGALTATLGAIHLHAVTSMYREDDLLLTETSDSFRSWLKDLTAATHDMVAEARVAVAARIADRLLAIGVERRREIAAAMMQRSFWTGLSPAGRTPRQAQEIVQDGLRQALRRAPMLGDLYLTAAYLDATLLGFTDKTDALVRLSRTYAPRELPVIAARLGFAPLVWPLLDEDHRRLFAADFLVVRQVQPERAAKIEEALTRLGVVLQ